MIFAQRAGVGLEVGVIAENVQGTQLTQSPPDMVQAFLNADRDLPIAMGIGQESVVLGRLALA